MTTTLAPTTNAVMKAWLNNVVGVPNAGTRLPTDSASWEVDGFVQWQTVAGSPEIYTPIRRPLMQLDFWAINVDSNKVPIGKANDLAERVLAATYDPANFETKLDLGDFGPARVLSTYWISEPRQIFDQDNDAARVMAQMQLVWVLA